MTTNTLTPGQDLNREELLVKSYLERAVNEPPASLLGHQLVQRFARETPALFSNAALSLLQSEQDLTALRYIIVKLLQQPDLMRRLTNPERLEKYASIRLFKILKQHDQALDVRLAQSLPSRYEKSSSELTLPGCGRALDVLDQASEGRRIVPILGHLVDHPAPLLSAKATLVIGKRVKSVAWTKRLLTTGDRNPRDRANAIEALWGLHSSEALDLMWDHSVDPHNRVAGNSVLGLHLLGEANAATAVQYMAHRPEPEFRATAAWLMEKMQRNTDAEVLKEMLKDPTPGVRHAALRALVMFHQEELRKQTSQPEGERHSPVPVQETVPETPVVAVLNEVVEPSPVEEPPTEQPPEPPVFGEPEFNLRLDGRTFSFKGHS